MQRLIKVLPRNCDPVLEPPGNRLPGRVDDSQRGVAIFDGFGDQADRDEIVGLVYRDMLALQLLIYGIEPLDAPLDMNHLYVRRTHQLYYPLLDLVEDGFQAGAAAFD